MGDYANRVFAVVRRIPRGKVATYGQVARLIGAPRTARYVGYALHANPEPGTDPGCIPCHRVVFKGDWILTSGTVDGQEATEETLAQAQEMGLSVYLQLNEGGSAVLSVLGTNMDGSWTAKDATTVELTFDGSSAEATLEGEELVMQQDGDVMRFKRGEIPPAASEVQRDENQAAEPEA